MSNKTAVDFAFEKLANQGLLITKDYKNLVAYREAKQMEREQMAGFFISGSFNREKPFTFLEYYKEIYGGQDE
jgi:hypothetical protein